MLSLHDSATRALAALLLTAACACNTSPGPTGEGTEGGEVMVPPDRPASPVAREDILERRPGAAPVDLGDYAAVEITYRLFGVEPGDGSRPATAVLADTWDWSTRAYEEGALLGRGHRVVRIADDGVVLRGARGEEVRIAPGGEGRLRVVRHRLDRVTRALGKHRHVVDTAAARAAHAEVPGLPPAERVEIYGAPAWKLGEIPEGSLFAGLDFRRGDLVLGVDDVSATEATLSDIARAATEDARRFRVRVVRNGAVMTRAFVPASR